MKDKHIIEILESGPFSSLTENDLRAISAHTESCAACARAYEAGALALNVYRGWARRPAATREGRFEQMSERLQINAEQKTKVQQILGDTRNCAPCAKDQSRG